MIIQFSIVIPLYNKAQFVIKALESVLQQNYKNYEVLIIDDGSTDDSRLMVENWLDRRGDISRFKLIQQVNMGVSAARNKGVEEAIYPYIAFLDADDYWKEHHLMNLMHLINTYNNDVDLFSNGIILQLNQEMVYPNLSDKNDFVGICDYFSATSISQGFINSSSACAKKDALCQYPFPVGMKNFEDVATWARIANSKGFAFSSARSVVHVVDNSEASCSVDFNNYIKLEQFILAIQYNQDARQQYIKKVFLLSVLAARIKMNYRDYLGELYKIIGKSAIVTKYTILGALLPKFILLFLRNRRKR